MWYLLKFDLHHEKLFFIDFKENFGSSDRLLGVLICFISESLLQFLSRSSFISFNRIAINWMAIVSHIRQLANYKWWWSFVEKAMQSLATVIKIARKNSIYSMILLCRRFNNFVCDLLVHYVRKSARNPVRSNSSKLDAHFHVPIVENFTSTSTFSYAH